jgi:hypothetical protein
MEITQPELRCKGEGRARTSYLFTIPVVLPKTTDRLARGAGAPVFDCESGQRFAETTL